VVEAIKNYGACTGPMCRFNAERCSLDYCRECCVKIHEKLTDAQIVDQLKTAERGVHLRPWGSGGAYLGFRGALTPWKTCLCPHLTVDHIEVESTHDGLKERVWACFATGCHCRVPHPPGVLSSMPVTPAEPPKPILPEPTELVETADYAGDWTLGEVRTIYCS
jgi:hypothetical protein